jgi:hypothetical protein
MKVMQTEEKTWKVLIYDTFEGEWYNISQHASEEEAFATASDHAIKTEQLQPSSSSGGQLGIQDKTYVETPDGKLIHIIA